MIDGAYVLMGVIICLCFWSAWIAMRCRSVESLHGEKGGNNMSIHPPIGKCVFDILEFDDRVVAICFLGIFP